MHEAEYSGSEGETVRNRVRKLRGPVRKLQRRVSSLAHDGEKSIRMERGRRRVMRRIYEDKVGQALGCVLRMRYEGAFRER